MHPMERSPCSWRRRSRFVASSVEQAKGCTLDQVPGNLGTYATRCPPCIIPGRSLLRTPGTCFGDWYVRGKLTGLGGICLGVDIWLRSYPFAAFNKPSTSDSSSALTDASIMLVDTPIVVHTRSPFVASISTRVIAPVAKLESSIRTL